MNCGRVVADPDITRASALRWVQFPHHPSSPTHKKSPRQLADYFPPLAQNVLMVFFPALNCGEPQQ
jgi:hypothetical protein